MKVPYDTLILNYQKHIFAWFNNNIKWQIF